MIRRPRLETDPDPAALWKGIKRAAPQAHHAECASLTIYHGDCSCGNAARAQHVADLAALLDRHRFTILGTVEHGTAACRYCLGGRGKAEEPAWIWPCPEVQLVTARLIDWNAL